MNKPLADAESSYDIAEPILEDLRSNPNVLNQHVIEKASTSIGGRPGIKLVYDYQTRDGLIIKGVQYGVLLAESYYYLVYEAAARYYFPRDYDTFEKVKDSFKILGLAEAPPPAGFR